MIGSDTAIRVWRRGRCAEEAGRDETASPSNVLWPELASKASDAWGSAVPMLCRGVISVGFSRNFESSSARITHLINCHGSDNEGSGPRERWFLVTLSNRIPGLRVWGQSNRSSRL